MSEQAQSPTRRQTILKWAARIAWIFSITALVLGTITYALNVQHDQLMSRLQKQGQKYQCTVLKVERYTTHRKTGTGNDYQTVQHCRVLFQRNDRPAGPANVITEAIDTFDGKKFSPGQTITVWISPAEHFIIERTGKSMPAWPLFLAAGILAVVGLTLWGLPRLQKHNTHDSNASG